MAGGPARHIAKPIPVLAPGAAGRRGSVNQCTARGGQRSANGRQASTLHARCAVMKNWKWEIEDDYAGPAPGAWAWIWAGIAVWSVMAWMLLNKH